ncbi:unnamed protein product [Boreogadus saida]
MVPESDDEGEKKSVKKKRKRKKSSARKASDGSAAESDAESKKKKKTKEEEHRVNTWHNVLIGLSASLEDQERNRKKEVSLSKRVVKKTPKTPRTQAAHTVFWPANHDLRISQSPSWEDLTAKLDRTGTQDRAAKSWG